KSAEVICKDLKKVDKAQLKTFVADTVIPKYLGIANVTDAAVAKIVAGVASGSTPCKHAVGHVVSDLAHLSWSTGGHSGVDVGLYAYGRGTKNLRGNYENTQVGEFLKEFLEVDLSQVTKLLANEVTQEPGFKWKREPISILTRRELDSHGHLEDGHVYKYHN
ncbi:vacuolar alkaline phosphatase, partial [Dipsacomyces acuminosporus]